MFNVHGNDGKIVGKVTEHVDPGKFLHFRVGYQMDVPTLRFASHMLQTSRIMAADSGKRRAGHTRAK